MEHYAFISNLKTAETAMLLAVLASDCLENGLQCYRSRQNLLRCVNAIQELADVGNLAQPVLERLKAGQSA